MKFSSFLKVSEFGERVNPNKEKEPNIWKIPHTGNTRPSHRCVIQAGEPIIYHESKSIPLLLSIPWVHVYTMSPFLYHESMSITWVLSNNKSHCHFCKKICLSKLLVRPVSLSSTPAWWSLGGLVKGMGQEGQPGGPGGPPGPDFQTVLVSLEGAVLSMNIWK